ncbi:hypothetical protein EJ04DRAFT_575343 [Polyplosphaeria fusca]|uniref:Uncharacterized protein n=1 Tax=Polyplosphaeria fusca TaxID=682080 RepID=A0A9P4R4I4_9PLEO|nr:hypothetical protein EJ04DRAFT_575343 [Polyplosphaeria fusca]
MSPQPIKSLPSLLPLLPPAHETRARIANLAHSLTHLRTSTLQRYDSLPLTSASGAERQFLLTVLDVLQEMEEFGVAGWSVWVQGCEEEEVGDEGGREDLHPDPHPSIPDLASWTASSPNIPSPLLSAEPTTTTAHHTSPSLSPTPPHIHLQTSNPYSPTLPLHGRTCVLHFPSRVSRREVLDLVQEMWAGGEDEGKGEKKDKVQVLRVRSGGGGGDDWVVLWEDDGEGEEEDEEEKGDGGKEWDGEEKRIGKAEDEGGARMRGGIGMWDVEYGDEDDDDEGLTSTTSGSGRDSEMCDASTICGCGGYGDGVLDEELRALRYDNEGLREEVEMLRRRFEGVYEKMLEYRDEVFDARDAEEELRKEVDIIASHVRKAAGRGAELEKRLDEMQRMVDQNESASYEMEQEEKTRCYSSLIPNLRGGAGSRASDPYLPPRPSTPDPRSKLSEITSPGFLFHGRRSMIILSPNLVYQFPPNTTLAQIREILAYRQNHDLEDSPVMRCVWTILEIRSSLQIQDPDVRHCPGGIAYVGIPWDPSNAQEYLLAMLGRFPEPLPHDMDPDEENWLIGLRETYRLLCGNETPELDYEETSSCASSAELDDFLGVADLINAMNNGHDSLVPEFGLALAQEASSPLSGDGVFGESAEDDAHYVEMLRRAEGMSAQGSSFYSRSEAASLDESEYESPLVKSATPDHPVSYLRTHSMLGVLQLSPAERMEFASTEAPYNFDKTKSIWYPHARMLEHLMCAQQECECRAVDVGSVRMITEIERIERDLRRTLRVDLSQLCNACWLDPSLRGGEGYDLTDQHTDGPLEDSDIERAGEKHGQTDDEQEVSSYDDVLRETEQSGEIAQRTKQDRFVRFQDQPEYIVPPDQPAHIEPQDAIKRPRHWRRECWVDPERSPSVSYADPLLVRYTPSWLPSHTQFPRATPNDDKNPSSTQHLAEVIPPSALIADDQLLERTILTPHGSWLKKRANAGHRESMTEHLCWCAEQLQTFDGTSEHDTPCSAPEQAHTLSTPAPVLATAETCVEPGVLESRDPMAKAGAVSPAPEANAEAKAVQGDAAPAMVRRERGEGRWVPPSVAGPSRPAKYQATVRSEEDEYNGMIWGGRRGGSGEGG